MSNPLKRAYVSELDQFLQRFDQEHPEKSTAQQQEIKKHQRLAQHRDALCSPAVTTPPEKKLWENF